MHWKTHEVSTKGPLTLIDFRYVTFTQSTLDAQTHTYNILSIFGLFYFTLFSVKRCPIHKTVGDNLCVNAGLTTNFEDVFSKSRCPLIAS